MNMKSAELYMLYIDEDCELIKDSEKRFRSMILGPVSEAKLVDLS